MQGSGMGDGGGGGGAPRARRQAGRAYARPPVVPRARRTRMPWRSSKASPFASAHEMCSCAACAFGRGVWLVPPFPLRMPLCAVCCVFACSVSQ
eukprot:2982065-Prymnesium_polylepis.1